MNDGLKVLELFAGSRSIGKVCDELGIYTYSTDLYEFEGIDEAVDILTLDYKALGFIPDIIWASPPCTSFSVASIGHHWGGGKGAYIPKTEGALIGLAIMRKTIEIDMIYYIENPRGLMRKMPEMEKLPRHTVTYCQYGDTRMKPTDIWSNNPIWKPRAVCKNGAPCHTAAPRGSRTGTQGLKGAYERSMIPDELCREVVHSAIEALMESL